MNFEQDIDTALTGIFAQTPTAPAVVDLQGRVTTYGDVNSARARIADGLARAGLTPQHRIATLLPDAVETAVLLLGLTTRLSVLPLNGALLDHELEELIMRAGVDAIIAQADDTRAQAMAARAGLPLIAAQDVMAGSVTLSVPPAKHAREPGLVLLTSGSTGTPKMVVTTPAAMVASARHIAATLGLGPDDRALHALPMFHIGAVVDLLLAPLLSGGSCVVCPERTPVALAHGIAAGGASWMQLVPTMLIRCLAEFDADALREMCAPLRFIRSVSADLSAQTQTEAEAACATPIVQMYGMTETAGQICSNPLDGLRKAASVGPAAGPDVAILDPSGNLLPPNREGEVCVRGETVFAGYEGQDTDDAFFDGWFRTGDLGQLDDDGYLFLTGRKKEMINQGGEKISPLEIERAALSCVGVTEAAAYPLSHPTLGDQPGLSVVGTAEEATVLAHLRRQLADYKCPRHAQVMDALPRLGGGKVDKRALIRARQPDAVTAGPVHYEGHTHEVATLWAQTLQTELPDLTTDFFDAGGDSLAATTFIVALEALIKAPVDPNLLFNAPVFGDMLDALATQNGQTEAEAPVLTYVRQMMAGWPGVPALDGGIIRSLGTAAQKEPVFWCGTQGYQGEVIQEALGRNHPVYAMMSTSLFPGRDDTDRATLAAQYVGEIQALQPEGPLNVGGFCDGARIMALVADGLIAAGREIRCFLAGDHWFTKPTQYPVFHFFSDDVRFSGAMKFQKPHLAYPVLHPLGAQGFRIAGGHELTADAMAGLAEDLVPIITGAAVMPVAPPPLVAFEDRSKMRRATMSVQMPRITVPNGAFEIAVRLRNDSSHTWEPTEKSGLSLAVHAFNFDNFPRTYNIAYADITTPIAAGETRDFRLNAVYPDTLLPTKLRVCVSDQGVCDWSKQTGGLVTRIMWSWPKSGR